MIYDDKKRLWHLQYGPMSFHIGAVELEGVTYGLLKALDPNLNPEHARWLRICELATRIRMEEKLEKDARKPEILELLKRIEAKTLKTQRINAKR